MGNRVDKIVGALVAIASGGLGAYAATTATPPGWLVAVIAALGVAAGLFRIGVFGTGAATAILVCLFLSGSSAGCGGLAAGYRTLVIVKKAGDETGKALAGTCKDKRLKCFKAHEKDIAKLRECLRPCKDALTHWTKHARPAINSALTATFAGLETAYAKKDKKADWLTLIKPAACALIKISKQWQPLMGDKIKKIVSAIIALEGMVCND